MVFKIYTVPWYMPARVLCPSQHYDSSSNMTHQIWIEKVCLLTSIMCSGEEQSYAKEVLEEQLNMGWVGLTSKAEEICLKLGLPNATRQYVHTEHELDPARLSNFKQLTVVLLEDRR